MPGLRLMAELGLDGSGFASGFRQAKGYAEGAGEGIKHLVIGAVGIGTVEEAIRRTVDTAKELVDTSERLAIAPEQLQVLRRAARDSNVEFEKVAEAFEKINIARQKALMPGAEGFSARRAFVAAGIGMDQLHSAQPLDLLRQIVNRGNPEQIGIIFRELGLKAFGPLIPLLKTNFDELAEKMKSVGAIMDTETAVKLKHLSDDFGLLSQIITSQLGPILIKLAEAAYTAFLKLSSKGATAVTAAGGLIGAQGAGGFATSLLSATGHSIAHLLGFISDKEFDTKMRALIPKAAVQNMGNPAEFWEQKQKEFADFLGKLKARAGELDHPGAPNFDNPTISPKIPKKALENPTDALIRIGNFLGGRTEGVVLARKQAQLLSSIDQSLIVVRGLLEKLPGAGGMDFGPFFPHS